MENLFTHKGLAKHLNANFKKGEGKRYTPKDVTNYLRIGHLPFKAGGLGLMRRDNGKIEVLQKPDENVKLENAPLAPVLPGLILTQEDELKPYDFIEKAKLSFNNGNAVMDILKGNLDGAIFHLRREQERLK